MNILDFKLKKERAEKITLLTCYDYPSARILAESEIDCVLVGDSVAMTVHGHENTMMATIEMMVLHTQAVARGLKKQFLISDLPFLSHRISFAETLLHVKQLLQAGAQAVKLEGADEDVYRTVAHLVTCGVPVMGHIGLMPQFIHQMGGYRIQGREVAQAQLLLEQAKSLEVAGCFALVVECIPGELAQTITQTLKIPVIGIGSGNKTDGQVLVWHDMLGLQTSFKPRFVKRFVEGKNLLLEGVNDYVAQVKNEQFPLAEHTFN